MIEWITSQLPLDNQFFAGGALLGIMAAAWHFTRGLPRRIWPFFQRRIFFTCTIDSAYTDAHLANIAVWLDRHGYGHKIGHVFYDQWNGSFVPGTLTTLVKYKGSRMLITHSHENESTQNGSKARKSVSITGMRTARKKVLDLVHEIKSTPNERLAGKTRIIMRTPNQTLVNAIEGRSLASLHLPKTITDGVLDDMNKFIESEQEYKQHGLPYHRAYLLQGPPGTGKSSFVQAIANEYKKSCTIISGLAGYSTNSLLSELCNAVEEDSIIVIEDIDACEAGCINTEDTEGGARSSGNPGPAVSDAADRLTLADLLNVLDGIMTPHGMMLFMTTNHPDRIDKRLMRPGRVDRVFTFPYMDNDHIRDMSLRLRGEVTETAQRLIDGVDHQMAPAYVQLCIMTDQIHKKEPAYLPAVDTKRANGKIAQRV